jgi:hypothetical protein
VAAGHRGGAVVVGGGGLGGGVLLRGRGELGEGRDAPVVHGGGEWLGEAKKRPAMGWLQWPSNSGSSRWVKAPPEGGGVTAKE